MLSNLWKVESISFELSVVGFFVVICDLGEGFGGGSFFFLFLV